MRIATLQLLAVLALTGCVQKTVVVRPVKKAIAVHPSHAANKRISEISDQIKKGN